MAENITVTTKKYMPPEYENRAKKLFYDVMEGRINAALMDPNDKVLLNRWLIYNLSEEERKRYNLVSPDEFDRMYPPEWEQPKPKPASQGGTGLGEIAKEFGRGLLSELTLGLANLPSPREHRGPLDPLAISRFLGGMVGIVPWFAAGMPWMRAGALAARAAGLGPVASIVLREGVAGALHGAARSVAEKAKEQGQVDVGRAITAGLEAGIYGAVGGRLLIARGAAGEVAKRISKKIQEHAKLFADSPAAQAGKINPVEEAVNTVARQINELAQAVRSQRTTTSQEIRNKFMDLLGIDPYKNLYFASPEHAVRFLEDLASKGVKAIPRAIIPRKDTGFLRRPGYAETVIETLTKAKEPPPAAGAKQTAVSSLEDLLARLTETPVQTTTAAKGSKTSPATQRKIDALLKALTQTEKPAKAAPAEVSAKQAEPKPPESLKPLVKSLFPEAEGTPPSKPAPKPTEQKPAQPAQRKKYVPPYVEKSARNILIALPEDLKSDEEALKFGATELRKRLGSIPAEVEWRTGPQTSAKVRIEQIDDDGMATIRDLVTGQESRVRLVRVTADRKAVTLDSRIQKIVDEYRKIVKTPGQRAVRAREAIEVKELGGLKAGDDVYFKPEGSEDGYVAKVNSIFVSTKSPNKAPSKIKVNLTVIDEHGNEIKRTITFDPNTFTESTDSALIYLTDAENRVVLWRPPKLVKQKPGGKTQRAAGKAR